MRAPPKVLSAVCASLVVCLAASTTPAAAASKLDIRGLDPALNDIYTAAAASGKLDCGGGSGKTVPFSAVNDDFCDCPGTNADEPGTSACAGLAAHTFPGVAGTPPSVHRRGDGTDPEAGGDPGASHVGFYCPNRGHHPATLPPSRVDDGHCDCCDGSDEPRASASSPGCPDTCRSLGAAAAERLRSDLASALRASQVRTARISDGQAEARQRQLERGGKSDERVKAEAERAEVQQRLAAAEEAEAAERERRQAQADREHEERVGKAEAVQAEGQAGEDGSADEKEKSLPEKVEYTDPAAEELRVRRKDIDSKIAKLSKDLDELREIDEIDAGPDGAYASMIDKCYTLDTGEYKYELCLFDKVTQSGQDLGSFVGWKEGSGHSAMEYKDGGHCWQGPKRSTLVHLACGETDEITNVHEPSKCVYEMTFRTPAACNPQHVEALQLELAHLEG